MEVVSFYKVPGAKVPGVAMVLLSLWVASPHQSASLPPEHHHEEEQDRTRPQEVRAIAHVTSSAIGMLGPNITWPKP